MASMKIALMTAPDSAEARTLARLAVEERLAACVQIIPGLQSIYRWRGAVEEAAELLLIFKTTDELAALLRDRMLAAHSYETPEFIVLDVEAASDGYLGWLTGELQRPVDL